MNTMKKQKPTKEEAIQYVFDYGITKAGELLNITQTELEKIINPEPEDIYVHKTKYKDVEINTAVASVIAKYYEQLWNKYVSNTQHLQLSQTDEDIFHNTLLKVMEESEIIEDNILAYIDYKLNMVRYQTIMDNKQLKKIITNANTKEASKTEE